MYRKLVAAAGTTALALTGLLAGAAPANATVWGCTSGRSSAGAHVVCTQGTGQYRVAQQCQNWLRVYTKTVTGAYVNRGQQSSVSCGGDLYLGEAWAQNR